MKPALPQGTRDFGPETVRRRNYIFQTIRTVFELYGFQPLETPAFENIETLMGKYGEEGDKLIFKILNNGLDNPTKKDLALEEFAKVLEGKNTRLISERALRYDLTIPFARYVAMNHGKLAFPYKRYQMQPVWRADRPQKGRYREFYQCDADVVGSYSLISEVEFAQIYLEVFAQLGIPVSLKINNRKILHALAQLCNAPDKFSLITVAIDKLDKIGLEKVMDELAVRGIENRELQLIREYLSLQGNNADKLKGLSTLFSSNEEGKKGIEELGFIVEYMGNNQLEIDVTLARGLHYYTGIIYEAKATTVSIGSIGGGGRYDDLTGLFDAPSIPGVGISFGVDRIYDVMIELNLFPEALQVTTKALFFNVGPEESKVAFSQVQRLRQIGISCELYHEHAKMDKQFKYAERKNIPYVVIIGSQEVAEKSCLVKHLQTGRQEKIDMSALLTYFTSIGKL